MTHKFVLKKLIKKSAMCSVALLSTIWLQFFFFYYLFGYNFLYWVNKYLELDYERHFEKVELKY